MTYAELEARSNQVAWLARRGGLRPGDGLIISGGVNIYPQEIENVLTMHPEVLDAAVLGVPDAEMGEQVKAVVQVARHIGHNAQ